MNAAFKVGLMTILTIATLLVGILFIWQINPYSQYQMISYFPHVGGIKSGSDVTLMGVKIGSVAAVVPEPLKRRVKVVMEIDREYKIVKGSSFSIVNVGLVGDKNVEVLPPPPQADESLEYLDAGAEVAGRPPSSLDAIYTEAQEMLRSARELVEDEDLREDIRTTVRMVADTSVQMKGLFKDVNKITTGIGDVTEETSALLKQINAAAASAIPEVNEIVRGVKRITGNVESLSQRVNAVANDPEILDSTKSSVRNISTLTERWNGLTDDLQSVLNNADEITQDIREITSDREIKSNLKTVARNASRLTNAVLTLSNPENQVTDDVDLAVRAEAMGVATLAQDFNVTPGAQVNFNVFGNPGLGLPVNYVRFGLDEIGDSNLINLQAGSELADGAGILRFGLVRGRIGAGTDLNFDLLGQPLTLSGELYDLNSPRMRLGVLQNLSDDYGVSLYWDNQFFSGINQFNLGFRWQPGAQEPRPKATLSPLLR